MKNVKTPKITDGNESGSLTSIQITIFNSVQKKADLCLNFDDKQQPLKNDQGVYVTWSKSTNSVLEDGVEGTALRFNGDRLEIPYYNNKVRWCLLL